MKRLFSTFLLVCCISITIYAQDGTDQNVDFQIVAQDNISTPIYRSPVVIPVRGYYISSVNTIFLYFAYDLGFINVRLENTYTGEYLSDTIPTDSGIQAIVLGPNIGLYTIILSTQTGQQYIAELLF